MAGTGLLLAALALLACGKPDSQTTPSIVIVTLDTLRRDHVGAYGSEAGLTPHLDALADRGLVHEQAFTTIPTTAPALASLFTGMLPDEHGMTANGTPLAAALSPRQVPFLLREAGYATAAFVPTRLLAQRVTGFDGFEVYDAPKQRLRDGASVVEAASRWLAVEARRPIFLWVHLYDAHAPYGVRHGSPGGLEVDPRSHGFVDPAAFADGSGRAAQRERYARGVRSVDAALGDLLESVRGLLDEPLILVAADHGEALDEHLESRHYAFDHGEFLDGESVRIPLVIEGPGVEPGRSGAVISIRDVHGTALRAAGVTLREGGMGTMWDLRVADGGERLVWMERRWVGESERAALDPRARAALEQHVLGVSDGRGLVVLGPGGVAPLADGAAPAELLDRARTRLEARAPRVEPARPTQFDAGRLEDLRSLGYLGDPSERGTP